MNGDQWVGEAIEVEEWEVQTTGCKIGSRMYCTIGL